MGYSGSSGKERFVSRRALVALAVAMLFCTHAIARPQARARASTARALRSMARVYMVMDRYATAREYATQAVAAALRDSESEAMISRCMIDLAWVDMQLGNFESAYTTGTKGLELQRQAYGHDHIYAAYTLRILSSISRERGDYRKARALLDESMHIMHLNAAGDNEIAPFLVDLAGILVAEGRYDEAEQVYDNVREKVLAVFGPSHLYTAMVFTQIAALHVRQGRVAEAETLISMGYPILQDAFGPNSYSLVDTWMVMAGISERKGDLNRAENMKKRALARVEEQFGSRHPHAARILGSLGEFYIDHGKYTEAAVVSPLAVERLKASLGEGHDVTAMAQNNLARLYLRQGRTLEASKLCSSAIVTLAQVFEPDHPSLVKVRQTLSSLLFANAAERETNIN
ncbi:MAG TPA: tetratricopeptide repeat protein [Sedimentisphaerales bacterium]|nr:tetratricopeptide repeat protein [Sedimentisphaerales bacterium]